MSYPAIDVDLRRIYENALLLREKCRAAGIEPTAVIKGFDGIDEIVDAIALAGYTSFASSRLAHVRRVKERMAGLCAVRTLALRIPMPSEAEDVVRWCDASLNSERATLERLDAAAARQGVTHGVILMRDLGDLREGFFESDRLVETACAVEENFSRLRLLGVGTSLSCYGTVRPSVENMSCLVRDAQAIERRIGRMLEVVSGGSSSSVPLVIRGQMPARINHVRIGSILMYRTRSLEPHELPGLRDAFSLEAEIVEIAEKPTHPIGVLGKDCFGNVKRFEDRGVRRRAILALGAFDIGDSESLAPFDENAHVLGCSSDHTIVDIHDSERDYRVGGTMRLRMHYRAIMTGMANGLMRKRFAPICAVP